MRYGHWTGSYCCHERGTCPNPVVTTLKFLYIRLFLCTLCVFHTFAFHACLYQRWIQEGSWGLPHYSEISPVHAKYVSFLSQLSSFKSEISPMETNGVLISTVSIATTKEVNIQERLWGHVSRITLGKWFLTFSIP